MKYTILMGSPNRDGNTAALLRLFREECETLCVEQEVFWLYEQDIRPCLGCKACQEVLDDLGCVHTDDLRKIYDSVQSSDLLVLATPIYSWFCTPPMKAALDRLIYAGCKYYGSVRGGTTYAGKPVATITTCGYRPEKGADLWEEGLRRWCKHTEMNYLGMFCHRDIGKKDAFLTEQVEQDVRNFARSLFETLGAPKKETL